ncbi:hypothetical protein V8G54_032718 [Vigna mungo]|uniref:Uncharacterized protein n=1 Tax=Vigna mungo TaxID=3915 RepID=A0AAQ3MML5_VIGMU
MWTLKRNLKETNKGVFIRHSVMFLFSFQSEYSYPLSLLLAFSRSLSSRATACTLRPRDDNLKFNNVSMRSWWVKAKIETNIIQCCVGYGESGAKNLDSVFVNMPMYILPIWSQHSLDGFNLIISDAKVFCRKVVSKGGWSY